MKARLLLLALLPACSTAPRKMPLVPEKEPVVVEARLAAGGAPLPRRPRLPPLPPEDEPEIPEEEPLDAGGLRLGGGVAASSAPVKKLPLARPEKPGAGQKNAGAALDPGGLPRRSTETAWGASGLTGERADQKPAPRPDPGGLGPTPKGSRYLSPAGLADLKIGRSFEEAPEELPPIANPPGNPEAEGLSPDAGAPPPSALQAQPLNMIFLENLDVASFRVQVATAADFAAVAFDKVYDFLDDVNLNDEYLADGKGPKAPGTPVWVRRAMIDLLGFQQPFTEGRRYALRARRGEKPK